jgi:hypothetical protein
METAKRRTGNVASNAIGQIAAGIAAVSGKFNVGSVSSSGQSQQGNVNSDGSYSRDDLDEEWKRRNGYHL